jgi:uncharacterized protein (UPF0333 family)
MLKLLSKRAQTTAEYAVLIALVVGAVVAMQVYIKRGLQGRLKSAVDATAVGAADTSTVLKSDQYEPYYLSSTAETTQNAKDSEDYKEGAVDRASNTETSANRNQTLGW